METLPVNQIVSARANALLAITAQVDSHRPLPYHALPVVLVHRPNLPPVHVMAFAMPGIGVEVEKQSVHQQGNCVKLAGTETEGQHPQAALDYVSKGTFVQLEVILGENIPAERIRRPCPVPFGAQTH